MTTWFKYECDGGSRWTSTSRLLDDESERICNFSGCNCNTTVRCVGQTTDLDEAHNWFRRPPANRTKVTIFNQGVKKDYYFATDDATENFLKQIHHRVGCIVHHRTMYINDK